MDKNQKGCATRPANQSLNNASPLCRDENDLIVAQYGQYTVLDSFFGLYFETAQEDIPKWPRFTPNCFEFTTTAHSATFSFAALATGNHEALVKYPLTAPVSDGYGLEKWLAEYQDQYGAIYGMSRTINSGYRTPAHNHAIGGATYSRHMLGDAIDFQSASHTLEELQDVNAAAIDAGADFVEDPSVITTYCANPSPPAPRQPYPCAHADWRYHNKGEYIH